MTELVVGWELVKYQSPRVQHELYYWENLSDGSISEMDYITTKEFEIIPIEVKAGTSGKMKSLRMLMRKKHLKHAIRTSLENFGKLNEYDEKDTESQARQKTIHIIPLYALSSATNSDI